MPSKEQIIVVSHYSRSITCQAKLGGNGYSFVSNWCHIGESFAASTYMAKCVQKTKPGSKQHIFFPCSLTLMFVTGRKAESSQSVREYEAGEAWTYAIDENEFYLAGEGRVIAKMNAPRIQMMLFWAKPISNLFFLFSSVSVLLDSFPWLTINVFFLWLTGLT